MVNLEWYRIFKIVADEENITHASEKLNISQPAVTKHIHNLEETLNIKLFERTNKGLLLTNEGKKIYNDIKESIIILEGISKKYSLHRSINLGSHATLLNKLFSRKISGYYKTYPDSKIDIINNNMDEMLLKLEKQEIDIVLSKKTSDYNSEKLEFIKLGELHDILVTNNSSNLVKETIIPEMLKNEILYMPRRTSVTCKNFFESLKIKEDDFTNIKHISYNTMIEIIKDIDGIGLMTKEYIKEEIEAGKITQLKTNFKIKPIDYGIYINKDNKFKELNEFIKFINR